MNNAILLLLFHSASVPFDLPDNLLASLCYVESTHNINAIHHHDGDGDSLGVCQVKLKTARWMGFDGSARELMDPSINAYYAAKYLAYQIERYDGDIQKALVAYNMGSSRGFSQSRYSKKVIKQWRSLR